jgi:glycerophosphoryl diester phosphodiesterase
LSFLVDKETGKLDEQLRLLGFIPDTYSPAYKNVTKELVDACHQKHIKVLPWTPNTKEEIKVLLDMGVDGVITDYPDLFSNFR